MSTLFDESMNNIRRMTSTHSSHHRDASISSDSDNDDSAVSRTIRPPPAAASANHHHQSSVSIRDITARREGEIESSDSESDDGTNHTYPQASSASTTTSHVQRLADALHTTNHMYSNHRLPVSPSRFNRHTVSSTHTSPSSRLNGLSTVPRSIPSSPNRFLPKSTTPSSTRSPVYSASNHQRSIPSSTAATLSSSSNLSNPSTSPSTDTDSLQQTVLELQKQLADQQLALVQERNNRFGLAAKLEELQANWAQSANQKGAQLPLSRDPLLNSSQLNSTTSINAPPAQWNQQLQTLQLDQSRKLATMTNLIEEQSREMVALRQERNEFLQKHEAATNALHHQNEQLKQQIVQLETHLEADRSRTYQSVHQVTLLQNELQMCEERAREHIQMLLQRCEAAKQENAQLRAIYVQEREQAQHQAVDLTQMTNTIHQLEQQYEQTKATSIKYKTKARDLVDRVRTDEEVKRQLQRSLMTANDQLESLKDRFETLSQHYASKSADLTKLQTDHADLRSELLGKTKELTELYAAYATAIEKHQEVQAHFQQTLSQALAERDARHQDTLQHHSFINTLVHPVSLSSTLQLDLHKSLAEKSDEVLKLHQELEKAREEAHQAKSELHQLQKQDVSDLTSLRARLERKMKENVELATKNQELGHQLQRYATKLIQSPSKESSFVNQSQMNQTSKSPAVVTHTEEASTAPSPPSSKTAHLYQQIVELHETISSLERQLKEKDAKLEQLTATASAATEARKALEHQVEVLQTHLDEFKSRTLPTPAEFRRLKEEQQREWAASLKELQQKEDEWREKIKLEREELERTRMNEESFVAKAVAIHSEEIFSEVDSLSALMSSRQNGMEPGIEHLVPKPVIHDSSLTLPQIEDILQKSLSDLRSLRRYVADEYAKGLSHECITQ